MFDNAADMAVNPKHIAGVIVPEILPDSFRVTGPLHHAIKGHIAVIVVALLKVSRQNTVSAGFLIAPSCAPSRKQPGSHSWYRRILSSDSALGYLSGFTAIGQPKAALLPIKGCNIRPQ